MQTAQNSAIRTAINMGVFEKIPTDGSEIGVADLAAALKVDETLLGEPANHRPRTKQKERTKPLTQRKTQSARPPVDKKEKDSMSKKK